MMPTSSKPSRRSRVSVRCNILGIIPRPRRRPRKRSWTSWIDSETTTTYSMGTICRGRSMSTSIPSPKSSVGRWTLLQDSSARRRRRTGWNAQPRLRGSILVMRTMEFMSSSSSSCYWSQIVWLLPLIVETLSISVYRIALKLLSIRGPRNGKLSSTKWSSETTISGIRLSHPRDYL